MNRTSCIALPLALAITGFVFATKLPDDAAWEIVEAKGEPLKRHEHAFVKIDQRFYALGGRRVQAVDIFNPAEQIWTKGKLPPVELHHFQALEWDGRVLVAGAFTGKYPAETPVAKFHFYDPKTDDWNTGADIPAARLRGSAGAFIRDGKLYLICGLTDGHRSGWVPWFDEYDFATGTWRTLQDAPRARDHFQAVLVGTKLVLAGGRRSGEGGSTFASVIKEVDVYDFETGTWQTLDSPSGDIPTPRAGTMAAVIDGRVVIVGGESARKKAHSEVEALDLDTGTWSNWPAMTGGRHATQAVLHEGAIYLQAGSVTRGGTETNSLARFRFVK